MKIRLALALLLALLPLTDSSAQQPQALEPRPPQLVAEAQPAPSEAEIAAALQKDAINARSEAARARREHDALKKEFDGWKAANAKIFEIKAANEKLAADAETLKKEMQALKADSDKASSLKNIYWFVAGAAVLAIGILIGGGMASSRRRGGSGGYRF